MLSALGAKADITLTTDAPVGTPFEFVANTTSATQSVSVDFGDGQTTFFTIDPNQFSSNRWIKGEVKGPTIHIDGNITEIECEQMQLTSVAVEGMTKLQKLILSNNKIEDFELVDTTPLTTLNLSNNLIENTPSWNANLTLDKAGETLTDLNISYKRICAV